MRLLSAASLLLLLHTAAAMMLLPNSTGWQEILDKYLDQDGDWWEAKQRGRRAITDSDAQLILDLHNRLRGQVQPPASNMEYMVGVDPVLISLVVFYSSMTFVTHTFRASRCGGSLYVLLLQNHKVLKSVRKSLCRTRAGLFRVTRK